MKVWTTKENIAFDYWYDYIECSQLPINQRMGLRFKPIQRPIGNFREEVIATAKYIREKTDKDIIVAMSGGIDSEVAARGFKEANIPFKCLIIDGKYNYHDISYAKKWCQDNNVEYIIHELDYSNVIEGLCKPYIDRGYRALRVFRYLQLYINDLVDKMNGTCIQGGGTFSDNKMCFDLPHTAKDKNFSSSNYKYDPSYLNILNHTTENIHFPYFFLTTPEMVASYLSDPLFKFCEEHPEYFKMPLYKPDISWKETVTIEKILIYHAYYTDLEHRQKSDGFENVREILKILNKDFRETFTEIVPLRIAISSIREQLGIV